MGQNCTWSEWAKAHWCQPNRDNLHLPWEYKTRYDLQEQLKMLSVSHVTFPSALHFCKAHLWIFPDHRLLNHVPSRALSCGRQSSRHEWNRQELPKHSEMSWGQGVLCEPCTARPAWTWATQGKPAQQGQGNSPALLCECKDLPVPVCINLSASPPASLPGGTKAPGDFSWAVRLPSHAEISLVAATWPANHAVCGGEE